MTPPPRTRRQRKQDTLQRLERDVDAWVAGFDHLRRQDAATARAAGT
jgi:hypothetical protein